MWGHKGTAEPCTVTSQLTDIPKPVLSVSFSLVKAVVRLGIRLPSYDVIVQTPETFGSSTLQMT
jgi:hypothetical protein